MASSLVVETVVFVVVLLEAGMVVFVVVLLEAGFEFCLTGLTHFLTILGMLLCLHPILGFSFLEFCCLENPLIQN